MQILSGVAQGRKVGASHNSSVLMGAGYDYDLRCVEFVKSFGKFIDRDIDSNAHMPSLILFLESNINKLGLALAIKSDKLLAGYFHVLAGSIVKITQIGAQVIGAIAKCWCNKENKERKKDGFFHVQHQERVELSFVFGSLSLKKGLIE